VTYYQKKNNFKRLNLMTGCVFICALIILGRLFYCQIIDNSLIKAATNIENTRHQRAEIFATDKTGKDWPIAVNIVMWRLIADPSKIDEPVSTLKILSPFLDIPSKFFDEDFLEDSEENLEFKKLVNRLSNKNSYYEVLKIIDREEKEKIKQMRIPGIYFEEIDGRFWPEKDYFGQITGFTRLENGKLVGQYGLEKLIDESGDKNLYITIDRTLQFFSCQLLKESLKNYKAEGGTIIVLNKEGAIKVMCNLPSFDPNDYSSISDFHLFQNASIETPYEPGSIFKMITMAAGLDSKKVKPETTYFDQGFVKIGPEPKIIKNSTGQSYGEQTMTNVLEKSLNTGAVWVAKQVGRDLFKYYVKEFGFGSLSGVELPEEAKGDIDNLDKPSEIYLATASFGQGLTATSLQLANAFLAVANQGKLYRPYVLRETGSYFVKQVISEEAAKDLTEMLVSVVENGYGRRAKVAGYKVAGKTGTAEVPEEGEYKGKVIHSFVGFAPAENPEFVALVKLDNPQIGTFSEYTAVPVFGQLADFVLKYYRIPPQ